MEYEELKSLWEKYDNRLDHLDKMNKKLLFESLSRKPRRMISFLKYKCINSIIIYPFALLIIIYSNFNIENIGLRIIVGSVLSFAIFVYLIYANIKTFRALNALDLVKDTVVESTKKCNNIKNIYAVRRKYSLISLPLLFWGIVLIYWSNNQFSSLTIVLLSCLFVILFLYNLKGSTTHKNMLKKMDREIFEPNEYVK